ncbi:MAG: Hpt domain-containing protein [Nitrincola sp.]|nr:Hpt domain-containing protein [Nitrincola sp.]
MNSLQQEIQQSDFDSASRTAHTLKGLLATFCAEEATNAALTLEQLAKKQMDCAEAWVALQGAIERLLPQLQHRIEH